MTMKKGLIFLFIFACACVLADETEKKEEKVFPLSPEGNVTLIGNEGHITISSWDRSEVRLVMTKRAYGRSAREAERMLEALEVQIQHTGDRLVIRELDIRRNGDFNFFDLFDGDFWSRRDGPGAWVDYEMQVPVRARLKVSTDEGNVDIENVEGSLSVEADEGEISLASIRSRDVKITLDEGDLRVENAENAEAGTWNIVMDEGSVLIDGCRIRDLDCHSDEGELRIRGLEAERFWLSADEGDILVELQPSGNGSYRLEADEGDLEIVLSGRPDLSVRLETSEGRIDTDFPITVNELDDGETAEGVIGGGRGTLRGYTDEGDIVLSRSTR